MCKYCSTYDIINNNESKNVKYVVSKLETKGVKLIGYEQ